MTRLEFLEKARERHGYKYSYPNLGDKILMGDIIDIIYDGVLYKQKVNKHIMGRCPEKGTPKKTTEEFIKECKQIWGDKYDYSITEYRGALKPIKVIYQGVIFEQIASSHLRYSPELNMNREWFIKRAKDKWLNKYDYSLVDYVNSNTKVKIIYKKTNEVFEQTPHNHLISSPEKIKFSTKKTTEEFIRESNIIHDSKYNYGETQYEKNNKKVIIICPLHGKFEITPISHLGGEGCQYCEEWNAKKIISKFLNKRKFLYHREYKFHDFKNLSFDFYIPSLRTVIEFNDIQHFQPVEHFGGIDAFEKIKINDRIKEDYCEENYINLISIKWNQIDQIESILSDILLLI
jgi:hypothetical protein